MNEIKLKKIRLRTIFRLRLRTEMFKFLYLTESKWICEWKFNEKLSGRKNHTRLVL